MGVYEMNSNKKFLHYFDDGIVYVSELKEDAIHSSIVTKSDWKNLTKVGIGMTNDALDINGALINGAMLEKLAQDLGNSRLIVNCEGLCFLNTKRVIDSSFNVEYYRLNDLFSWSDYGVHQAIETTWNRCDIRQGDVLVDYMALQKSAIGKEEELIKMKEEMETVLKQLESGQDEAEKKEQELKKAEEEAMRLRQQAESTEAELKSRKEEFAKKEEEFKKIEAGYKALQQQLSLNEADLKEMKQELEKKKKELKRLEQVHSTETRLLEEEIQKKEKKLEQAEEEYNALRKDLWSAEAELKMKKEELEAKQKELKKVQEKSMELQRNLTYSEIELRLKKRQLDKVKEESQTKKEESDSLFRQLTTAQAELKFTIEDLDEKVKELEKVKEEAKTLGKKYSIIESELNVKKRELELKDKELQELKELENHGFDMLGRNSNDYFLDIVLRRQRPFSSQVLFDPPHGSKPVFVLPRVGEVPRVFKPVDGDRHVRSSWSNLAVHTSDGQFDGNNWWTITVTEKDDPREFVVAYYVGTFDYAEAYGVPVAIPYRKGSIFRPAWFSVSHIRGIGLRFSISYG